MFRNLGFGTLMLAIAAGAAAGGRYDPAACARRIAPFVEAETLAVVRIDIARVDVEALWGKLREPSGAADDPERAKVFEAENGAFARWVGDFLKAGGQDLYFLINPADLPDCVHVTVVPLGRGADGRAIAGLVVNGGGHTRTIRGAVVGGSEAQLDRIAALQPVDRPELAKAFAAAGEATVQILLIPTPDARRVIEEVLLQLPADVGGGPATLLTGGMMWAGIGLNGPPKMALRAAAQSKDAASAQAFCQRVPTLWRALLVKPLGFDKAAEKEQAKLAAAVKLLTPTAVGDRLVLTLDDRQINKAISDLAPLFRRAREQARVAQSVGKIKYIWTAIAMYAEDPTNKGRWPRDFAELVESKLLAPELLVNPRRPKLKPGYVYVRPPEPIRKIKRPAERVAVYEAYETWPGYVTVGFADGHVQVMTEEARFLELLKEAQAAAAKPPE